MAKKEDEFRWNSMSKAELIKTVKTLHRRQTKLLNEITALKEVKQEEVPPYGSSDWKLPEVTFDQPTATLSYPRKLPWETNELPNPFDEVKT
jgi:hypothetical protein